MVFSDEHNMVASKLGITPTKAREIHKTVMETMGESGYVEMISQLFGQNEAKFAFYIVGFEEGADANY